MQRRAVVRLVTLLLGEACPSRNGILSRENSARIYIYIYIGIGKSRSENRLLSIDRTSSEVFGYVSIPHINCLFNFGSRKSAFLLSYTYSLAYTYSLSLSLYSLALFFPRCVVASSCSRRKIGKLSDERAIRYRDTRFPSRMSERVVTTLQKS